MFFSVITKNLNWEILTKNLVTFIRLDEELDEDWKFLRMKYFNMRAH